MATWPFCVPIGSWAPRAGRLDGVGGDADVAVGAVLEAESVPRCRRGQFAVDSGFLLVRAPIGTPADQIPDVLGEITSRNSLGLGTPRRLMSMSSWRANAQPFRRCGAAVQVGSLIRPFQPTVVRGLFKVHAHDDFQRVCASLAHVGQAAGVVQRGLGVVNGAGADDDQQAVILVAHDALDVCRVPLTRVSTALSNGKRKRMRCSGRGNTVMSWDAFVVGLASFGAAPLRTKRHRAGSIERSCVPLCGKGIGKTKNRWAFQLRRLFGRVVRGCASACL